MKKIKTKEKYFSGFEFRNSILDILKMSKNEKCKIEPEKTLPKKHL
jgi:hypothetical protein